MRSGYGGTRFKGNDSHHKWKWEFFGVEVEKSASWGLDGQWRIPDTHLANRQDYALSDAEEKLKATILKQRRPADVLTHPGRLWLCGLAPRLTKMSDRQASPSKETMDLATIQRLRAEKKAKSAAEKSSTSTVVKDHVAAALPSGRQTTPPTSRVAPAGVGDHVVQQPASSVAILPKGASGLMDELELTLKKLKKAVQKEKDKEKRQKEAALKDVAELQEEVKMAKKAEEDARGALEQEKLGRQADKVTASKDKAALEAQVAALESKLQNDFIEVLDAAVVSSRHMASKYMGVDLSDVPLKNPEFPEGYELPACLRPSDASAEMEDRVNLEDQANRSSHSSSKRQRTK
ncbi:hypothetical protein COLO4_05086 [Corchorus olitorius]|uniref:Uncharacterized protein n=1 Tax=Corchorus olitorius TaxID=93759 RepID=A0A1R3KRZ8_9ROSI|nr:hypothetical protein COLO4_05086 [Corchorus olitorius]